MLHCQTLPSCSLWDVLLSKSARPEATSPAFGLSWKYRKFSAVWRSMKFVNTVNP